MKFTIILAGLVALASSVYTDDPVGYLPGKCPYEANSKVKWSGDRKFDFKELKGIWTGVYGRKEYNVGTKCIGMRIDLTNE